MGAISSAFCLVLCPLVVLAPATVTQSADFFEVMLVSPSRKIDHEVDLKGPFDSEITETFLLGPTLFAQAIGYGEDKYMQPRAYLTGYSIERPTDEPNRVLNARDSLQGSKAYSITIGKPALLLSPAQRLATGVPNSLPERISYLKAYRIVKGAPEGEDVKLNETMAAGSRKVLKAAYFCVPVEHWHHDQHSTIKSTKDCLVIYELQSQNIEETVRTLDQFGLNTLKTSSSKWLCVPAEMVSTGSAANQ